MWYLMKKGGFVGRIMVRRMAANPIKSITVQSSNILLCVKLVTIPDWHNVMRITSNE